MNRNILVTGGKGFIGSHLSTFLIKNGYNVNILEKSIKNNLKITYKTDLVIHLAAKFNGDKDYIKENNIDGTLNVLEFCKNNNTKLLFASTIGVYGNPRYLPIDENHPLNPINIYSKSKLETEMLCKDFSNKYNLETIILRLANVYGVGQKIQFLIPSILEEIKKNKEIILNSSNDIKRDFIYIDDVLGAFLKCINFKGNNFEIFNIGSGHSISIAEIVKIFSELLNKKLNIKYLELKGGVKEIYTSYAKAKSLLNWSPKISIKQGINYTLLHEHIEFP